MPQTRSRRIYGICFSNRRGLPALNRATDCCSPRWMSAGASKSRCICARAGAKTARVSITLRCASRSVRRCRPACSPCRKARGLSALCARRAYASWSASKSIALAATAGLLHRPAESDESQARPGPWAMPIGSQPNAFSLVPFVRSVGAGYRCNIVAISCDNISEYAR